MNYCFVDQGPSNALPFITAGLYLLDVIKKKMSYSKSVEVDEIIASMKVAASHAETNFRNKLELLEAEKYVITPRRNNVVALQAYDTAIASAQKAGFLHEQGLACEKAGLYCKSTKDNDKALTYFNQALECYEKWGSSVKVEFIRKELSQLSYNEVWIKEAVNNKAGTTQCSSVRRPRHIM